MKRKLFQWRRLGLLMAKKEDINDRRTKKDLIEIWEFYNMEAGTNDDDCKCRGKTTATTTCYIL